MNLNLLQNWYYTGYFKEKIPLRLFYISESRVVLMYSCTTKHYSKPRQMIFKNLCFIFPNFNFIFYIFIILPTKFKNLKKYCTSFFSTIRRTVVFVISWKHENLAQHPSNYISFIKTHARVIIFDFYELKNLVSKYLCSPRW